MVASTFQQRATRLLGAVATVALQTSLAVEEIEKSLAVSWVGLAMALGFAAFLHRRMKSTVLTHTLPVAAVLALMALVAWTFVWEGVSRGLFRAGIPFEVVLVYSLRNLMFGLLALPQWRIGARLAAASSLVLVLFAFVAVVSPVTMALTVLYAAIGIGWLIGRSWDRLRGRFPTHTATELPRFASLGAASFVLAVVSGASVWAASSTLLPSVGEWFFGSGGTSLHDPLSRAGFGEGDQMVGGREDATIIGPVETDLFLEANMPAMYDIYSDTLGEPACAIKERQRAIGLTPDLLAKQRFDAAKNEQAASEFSTVRRPSPGRKAARRDVENPSLLYVRGPMPVHLKMEAFNCWDGVGLRFVSDEQELPQLRLAKREGLPWVELVGLPPGMRSQEEVTYVVSIINLHTNRVPSPAGLKALHLHRLHKADYFRWTDDAILRMDRDFIPQLCIFRIKAARASRDQLRDAELAQSDLPSSEELSVQASSATVARLARQWSQDVPSGWSQVEAICDRLKSDYRLDPMEMVPEHCDDAVEHFLSHRAGPSYLFATTAALMLHELSYQARVVSGFYGSYADYDPQTNWTKLGADDVHFWTEVLLADGTWQIADPSPGHDVAYARETIGQQCLAGLLWLRQLAVKHGWLLFGTILGLGLIWWRRGALRAWVYMEIWRWHLRRPVRSQVLWTVWLIEQLASVAGKPRQPSMPVAHWLTRLTAEIAPDAIPSFIACSQWALYGSHRPCPSDEVAVSSACRGGIATVRLALREKGVRQVTATS